MTVQFISTFEGRLLKTKETKIQGFDQDFSDPEKKFLNTKAYSFFDQF